MYTIILCVYKFVINLILLYFAYVGMNRIKVSIIIVVVTKNFAEIDFSVFNSLHHLSEVNFYRTYKIYIHTYRYILIRAFQIGVGNSCLTKK